MANELLDAIQQGNTARRPLLWLDAQEYGSRVVLKGQPFPWTDPSAFVSAYGQIQNLLKADVAPVHLGAFLHSWLSANSAALNEMSGKKRVRFALKRLLGMEEQRQLIREIVSALCDSRSEPVVLVLPPNGELINWANGMANKAEPVELTAIDIDSVSVYLADFIRAFSGLNIAGVLVELPKHVAIDSELLELYSPIINVARHYHWALGMKVSGAEVADQDDQLQFIIGNDAAQLVTGIVQHEGFWQGAPPACQAPHFVYARVPPQMTPETVLERLAALRD